MSGRCDSIARSISRLQVGDREAVAAMRSFSLSESSINQSSESTVTRDIPQRRATAYLTSLAEAYGLDQNFTSAGQRITSESHVHYEKLSPSSYLLVLLGRETGADTFSSAIYRFTDHTGGGSTHHEEPATPHKDKEPSCWDRFVGRNAASLNSRSPPNRSGQDKTNMYRYFAKKHLKSEGII